MVILKKNIYIYLCDYGKLCHGIRWIRYASDHHLFGSRHYKNGWDRDGFGWGKTRASAADLLLQAMPIAPACAVVVAPCAPSAPCWPCAAPGGSCAARRRGAGANRRIQMRTASNVCLKQQPTTLVISCIYRELYLLYPVWCECDCFCLWFSFFK